MCLLIRARLWPIFSTLFILFSTAICSKHGIDISAIDSHQACEDGQTQLVKDRFGYVSQVDFDPTGLFPYPNGMNCTWTFLAPVGEVIFFRTMILDLENDGSGSLTFHDGLSVTKTPLQQFYGRDRFGKSFRSPTNALTLQFVGRKRTKAGSVPQTIGFKLYFEQTKPPIFFCPANEKRCRHRMACIPKSQICNGIDECQDGTDEEGCQPSSVQKSFRQKCGWPAIKPAVNRLLRRVVGGNPARPGSWPWQVSMRLARSEPEGHKCGAIVIDGRWLLTAAHCFYEYYNIKDWTLHFAKQNKMVKDPGEVIRYIDKLFVHDGYVGGDENDDIALIRLNAYLPANHEMISAVCLPDDLVVEDVPGRMVAVTGFGETMSTGFSLILKQALIPLITLDQCRDWLKWMHVSTKMICAGTEAGGQDTCQGDSGGPMVVSSSEGKWTVIGVTSSGSRLCGQGSKSPGVYTRVASYRDWILKIISEN